jgi:hypothetical protein
MGEMKVAMMELMMVVKTVLKMASMSVMMMEILMDEMMVLKMDD